MHAKTIKQLLIVFIIILFSSCSVIRRGSESTSEMPSAPRNARLLFDVHKNNISENSFRFDRVRVVFEAEGDQKRFSGNVKYDNGGKILFSIRTIGGIEVARVYADRERVILIDRINRVYMEGDTETLFRKYGLSWDDRQVIFGDLPERLTIAVKGRCQDNKAEVPVRLGNRSVLVTVDCNDKKVSEIVVKEDNVDQTFKAVFKDYSRFEGDIFPGTVNIEDSKDLLRLEITYGRYSRLETGIDVPVAPSGYDKGRLL